MTGLIVNGTLTQFFEKYFCLTWVPDIFCAGIEYDNKKIIIERDGIVFQIGKTQFNLP